MSVAKAGRVAGVSRRPPATLTGWTRTHWLRVVAHLGALAPLAALIWDGAHNQLTVNPIQEITSRTGKTALLLLVLSLACTPLNTVGFRPALPLRRPLGLYAFMYAGLHLLTFAALDYGLDLGLIQQAIVEKRYILAGFAAFLLLAPLAVTSTQGWMRRLGKRWKRLHRLVYLAAALAVLHYLWLVKADIREPLLYGAAVGGLLALRLPRVRRSLARLGHRRRPPTPPPAATPVAPGRLSPVLPSVGGSLKPTSPRAAAREPHHLEW